MPIQSCKCRNPYPMPATVSVPCIKLPLVYLLITRYIRKLFSCCLVDRHTLMKTNSQTQHNSAITSNYNNSQHNAMYLANALPFDHQVILGCVCRHTNILTYTNNHTHTRIHKHLHLHTYSVIPIYTHTYTHTHTHIHKHLHLHTHSVIPIYTHTHTHTQTHTHTHTQLRN